MVEVLEGNRHSTDMEGLAFSDSELLALLPRDLSEHDSCYWLVATQAGWAPREGTPCETWEALEALLAASLMEAPALAERGWNLFDAGKFSKVVPYLQLDEWTYLIGFPSIPGSPDDVAKNTNLTNPLGPGFFDSLSRHQATAFCYIDGWWECFPATSPLLIGAGTNLKRVPTHSDKWLRFAEDRVIPVFPDSLAERSETSC